MDIYFKENIGLKTPQAENCDYFTIKKIGADLETQKATAELYFWENLAHAQNNKPANVSRTIDWDIIKETSIDAGIETLLTSEVLTTTNGETISLKGSERITD